MDIFIKSFARPYYLDRCLRSIYTYLHGDFNIIVLDDGTPLQYLERIKTAYPKVRLLSSPHASVKRELILESTANTNQKLAIPPFNFWKQSIGAGSEYFLLLEEDAWLTGDVDAEQILHKMQVNNLVTTKLFWGGCDQIVSGEKYTLGSEIEKIIPALPSSSLSILRPLLKNKFRIRSVLTKTRLISNQFLLPYYTLYTVASAFFRKDFWMYCWQQEQTTVDETLQLLKAVEWKNLHAKDGFGKTQIEKVKTSYLTTSLNTYKDISFDMVGFNLRLSNIWLKGDFDVMENFPGDFNTEFLEAAGNLPKDGSLSAMAWKSWFQRFKQEYRSLGIDTD